ncbi:MAG TPA: hypothetical protein VN033_00535 [Vulgatibacter sp.]|nr:hypothetical protein [Vulgatibacter sp.]
MGGSTIRVLVVRLVACLGAALLGFGAGRLAAPAPAGAPPPLGDTEAAWKARDAARTRLEIRLAGAVARRDRGAILAEAEALAALDPFHPRARAELRRIAEGEAALAAATGASDAGASEDAGARSAPEGSSAGPGGAARIGGGSTPEEERAGGTSGEEAAAKGRSGKDAVAAAAARSTSAYEAARRRMRLRTHEAIDARHPHAGIAAALKRHAWDGRLEQAIEDLRKLRGAAPEAAGILDSLRAIAAGLEGGRAVLAEGRLSEADPLFGHAFEAERSILPAEVSSVAVREARRQLAQAWFEEGRRFLGRDQLDDAVAAWRRGLAADPSHLDLRAAIQRAAERAAAR